MLSDAKYPYASGVESSLAERCRRTHGRIPRFTKYRQRTRQIKPEEMLHKSDVNFHKGVTQGLSEPTCVSVHTYCTVFLLINTLFHYCMSLWEFFSANLKGQGLVTDHWSSSSDLVLSLP